MSSCEEAPRFSEGDLLADRFAVVRYIDRGGTGEVYEAEDTSDGRRVALKALLPELADDAYALQLFRREVDLARCLDHPGICRVHELRQHGPTPFLTMELLGGETLGARLEHGPLPAGEVLPIARQMGAALSAAHRAGLVHGDFKPSNVMLVSDAAGERVVVTDFGTAPAMADVAWVTPETVAGTPAYMAPEQARGQRPTPAADIYSFGVVLFEMVTGALPHEGRTAIDLLQRRVDELAPTPASLREDLDPRWELVILRCLEPEPEDRFATIDEVVRALEGGRIVPSPAELARRRRSRVLLCGAGILALAAVAASIWLSR